MRNMGRIMILGQVGRGCAPIRRLSVFILAWCLGTPAAKAEDLSPLHARLLREGSQGWKAYQEFWNTLQGQAVAQQQVLLGAHKGEIPLRLVFSQKRRKGYSLNQLDEFRPGSYRGHIAVWNPDYSFDLIRQAEQKPWVVQDLVRRSPGVPDPEMDLAPGLDIGNTGGAIHLLFESAGLKISEVTSTQENGQELARVRYAYTPTTGATQKPCTGWLLLDPNHDWMIREGEIEVTANADTKVHERFIYEYKEGSGHHPIFAKHSNRVTVWKKGQIESESEHSGHADYIEKAVPASEFTLTAFGIPEPPWLESERRVPWYLWAAIAGFISVVGGVLLRRIGRRAA